MAIDYCTKAMAAKPIPKGDYGTSELGQRLNGMMAAIKKIGSYEAYNRVYELDRIEFKKLITEKMLEKAGGIMPYGDLGEHPGAMLEFIGTDGSVAINLMNEDGTFDCDGSTMVEPLAMSYDEALEGGPSYMAKYVEHMAKLWANLQRLAG